MAVEWDGRYASELNYTEACAKPQPGAPQYGCELEKDHDGYHAVFLPSAADGEVPGTMAFQHYEDWYGQNRAYFGDDGEVT